MYYYEKKEVKIFVEKQIHERLEEDRKHFQKVIGGGKWSISDTITEYLKILNAYKIDLKKIKRPTKDTFKKYKQIEFSVVGTKGEKQKKDGIKISSKEELISELETFLPYKNFGYSVIYGFDPKQKK